MVVAIDGPAGVGKSTVARDVARETGFLYLNSGNFYRSVTWSVLIKGLDPADRTAVIKAARDTDIELRGEILVIDGREAEPHLHTDEVDRWVAAHSAVVEVRDAVNLRLRRACEGRNVVADGRDMGTVVFPEAEVKVFLDADVETRAERRFRQGVSGLSLPQIRNAIEERDRLDRTKPVGRLDVAPGALYIDTSHLTIKQVCERVIKAILLNNTNPGDARQV
jgi:cytidylate kinase